MTRNRVTTPANGDRRHATAHFDTAAATPTTRHHHRNATAHFHAAATTPTTRHHHRGVAGGSR